MMRLSAQMEAVSSQLQQAERVQKVKEDFPACYQVSATMKQCLPGMQAALGHMEKIGVRIYM